MLFEAWQKWYETKPIADSTLWGIQILWLGRWGKILECIGAATVLVEIIGAEKFRDIANNLKSTFSLPKVTLPIKKSVARAKHHWLVLTNSAATAIAIEEVKEITLKDMIKQPLNILELIIFYGVGYLAWHLSPFDAMWPKLLLVLFVIYLCFLLLPVFMVLIVVVLSVIPGIIVFIFNQLAWAMEHPQLNRATKLFALICLVAGFHFDLLAS